MEQTEKEVAERQEKEAKRLESDQFYKNLHLDYADQLFPQFFTGNQDYDKYRVLAEEALQELREDARGKFAAALSELQLVVQKQRDLRREELQIYQRCVQEINVWEQYSSCILNIA